MIRIGDKLFYKIALEKRESGIDIVIYSAGYEPFLVIANELGLCEALEKYAAIKELVNSEEITVIEEILQ